MLKQYYDVAIIGGGILGASIAYFVSSSSSNSVILFEMEQDIAMHASNRNTGKVHAPFLYDPINKRLFARAAYLGFHMLREYCIMSALPFKLDGVLSVATHEKAIDLLYKYLQWGMANGLKGDELFILDSRKISNIEPNVKCKSAIYCSRDASVNYGAITRNLIHDAVVLGCTVATGMKVVNVTRNNLKLDIELARNYPSIPVRMRRMQECQEDDSIISEPMTSDISKIDEKSGKSRTRICVNYLINAAGGNALEIAHLMNAANEYTNIYFRGDYWRAPQEYQGLTKLSIYSVPKFPEYPFLDPHWIVRYDGSSEVGPNAVPVFGPYSYDWLSNTRFFIPKILEIARNSGIPKLMLNRRFFHLLTRELMGSISKTVMINRVRDFLPILRPSHFVSRGTAGIRSLLVDSDGKLRPEMVEIEDGNSLHLLNYNSPGATGALPISASIVSRLLREGVLMPRGEENTNRKNRWDINLIDSQLKGEHTS